MVHLQSFTFEFQAFDYLYGISGLYNGWYLADKEAIMGPSTQSLTRKVIVKVTGSEPYGACASVCDPHLVTFDGGSYSFMVAGACTVCMAGFIPCLKKPQI